MAPRLSDKERLEYLAAEREYIEEVLDDAQDCKWLYQALIECTILESKVQAEFREGDGEKVTEWLQQLKILDPLRKGRWADMEHRLTISGMPTSS